MAVYPANHCVGTFTEAASDFLEFKRLIDQRREVCFLCFFFCERLFRRFALPAFSKNL
jgi:hypothetical protein